MDDYRQAAIRAWAFGIMLILLAFLPEATWWRVALIVTAFAWFLAGIRRFAFSRRGPGGNPLSIRRGADNQRACCKGDDGSDESGRVGNKSRRIRTNL